jgi:hypothetical protein
MHCNNPAEDLLVKELTASLTIALAVSIFEQPKRQTVFYTLNEPLCVGIWTGCPADCDGGPLKTIRRPTMIYPE